MTVNELLNRMTSKELSEWMAYYKVNPFGEWRADFRNALLCQVNANLHSKKNYNLKEFMPTFSRFKKMMSWQMMKELLKATCKHT